MTLSKLAIRKPSFLWNRWLEILIAIIAALNFSLVLFDMSYVPWRDFYFRQSRSITQVYDPIKGIAPHRVTQNYLNRVNELEKQVDRTGLDSAQVENLLQELRILSKEMIEENPFAGASKSGTWEKIKKQIRERVGINSSHQAFDFFWSKAHLTQAGWQEEINFFNTQTRPLIQTNYYRKIGTNGKFIDKFWRIDLPFVILFGLEFLVRTFSISRHYIGLSWPQAMLRRWYDLFLLLPFWRWLRVISVTIRLDAAHLVNLEPVRKQINHDVVANFAEELTEIVGIRLINQIQESIQRGDVARWLFYPETRRPYIHVNNTNEVKAIATRLLHLSVYQVIPKIQPDLEALLRYSIESLLKQSPVYQQLQNMPGLSQLPTQLTEQLVKDISQAMYGTMTTLLQDPVAAEHANQVIQNFSQALQGEVQKQQNLQEIQSLLIDMLEEIKINYVKGIAAGGVDKILDESEQLQQILHQR